MQDRARTQFLSAVVLVVVFAAGGLVGAAVAGSGDEAAAAGPVALADSEEATEERDLGNERRSRYMFEQAGATEAQSEYIRSEIFPWYRDAIDALDEDSTFLALDARADSARDAWRASWRELEAYYDPKREALEDSARALIRDVLDPPAQVAYDSIVAERNRRQRDDDDGNRRHP